MTSLTMMGMCLGPLVHALFVPILVKSKCDVVTFVVFVPIWVESKGGWLIKCFSAQIPEFSFKFQNKFYSYSHGMTLPHLLRSLLLNQKHDLSPSNGIRLSAFKSWYQEYQGHCFHSMCWWPGVPNTRTTVPWSGHHYSRSSSYSTSRGRCWNRGRVYNRLPFWK